MKKKYIIIEDERLAYDELKRMMKVLRPEYELLGWAVSVEQAVHLIKNISVDLMLVDIRLADGDSFEIFEQVHSEVPIIFTTAYDEYALKAFKLHSIDYLLKPITDSDLDAALRKFEKMSCISPISPQFSDLREDFEQLIRTKNRFLIKQGDYYRHINTSEIAFFYSEEKYTFLHTFSNKRYIIDYTIDRLQSILDSKLFFRVSRGCIVNINSINKISKHFAGRLKLQLFPECHLNITIPRNRTKDFLDWIDDIK